MRDARPPLLPPSPVKALVLTVGLTSVLATFLMASLALSPAALAKKAAPGPQEAGEKVQINGRVASGLAQTFIKDKAQGYLLVRGLDLSRYSGRHIQAKGLVIGQEREFRVVRLLEYRLTAPDDDSPGAGGTGGPAGPGPARKKK